MNALAIDHDELFTIQVRALQSMYPQAHKDFLNWAEWSRDTGMIPGLTNHIKSPSFWDQYDPANDTDGFGDEGEARQVPQTEIKPEAAEKLPHDPKHGEQMDLIIHDPDFPEVWRKVIKAAYYFRIPVYQYPYAARLDPDNFLRFLEGALQRLDG